MKFGPRALTQSAYLKWHLYWKAEPWGPFRDNLHAAVIAAQVKALRAKRGTRISLSEFMVVDPTARARENRAGFLALLRMVGRPRAEVKRRMKGRKRARRR